MGAIPLASIRSVGVLMAKDTIIILILAIGVMAYIGIRITL